jgi:hypothetical protein
VSGEQLRVSTMLALVNVDKAEKAATKDREKRGKFE